MRFIISPEAESDLKQIHLYIEKSDPQAATKVIKSIFQHIDQLKIFPKIGHSIKNFNTVRCLIVTDFPYYIFYEIDHLNINILRIYHTSRQLLEKF